MLDRVHPLHAEIGLLGDGGDVFYSGEGCGALLGVGHVVVEQGEVELHVHGLFEELAGKVEAGFGGVDVLVEVEDEVVGDDGVAGGEEGDEAPDDVDLRGGDALAEIDEVGLEIDLFYGPGVFYAVAEHVVEDGEAHGAQSEAEAGVEDVGGGGYRGVGGVGGGGGGFS